MTSRETSPRLKHASATVLTGNSLLRLGSVGVRALLTLAMAVWLQPSELGLYALIAATLTLTTYLYGLDFQTFTMRELSTGDLAGARLRIRDQFALLLVIYAIGSAILAVVLRRFGLQPELVGVVVFMAALQHASLEVYRIFSRLGRPVAGTIVLFVRDAAWVPLCFLMKLVTGDLSLAALLVLWLAGSIASAICGLWMLIEWLPASARRPIDLAWLASGLRTGLRMLAGTLSLVALFTVDRMIFATMANPDQLGAYALFALGCASLQGLFETAILPSFWAPLLQAKKDGDHRAYVHADEKLVRVCLLGGAAVGIAAISGLTVLAWLLPHPAYAANLDLLYYIAAAYSVLILTNIPHYRLYAAKLDTRIVTANVAAFAIFLILVPILAKFDKSSAVPLALALACAARFVITWVMVRRFSRAIGA